EELLRGDRLAVLAVAHALETHKTISGDDIEAIVEGRQGPLVDGRVYSDPGFAAVIEAYHEQAMSAHREHGHFDIPLPRVNPNHLREALDEVAMVPRPGHGPWVEHSGSEASDHRPN
ncbi:MAG: hypothetical protein ACRDRT_14400, partial [Pseudonocardiaceae bacterium]